MPPCGIFKLINSDNDLFILLDVIVLFLNILVSLQDLSNPCKSDWLNLSGLHKYTLSIKK